MAKSKKELDKDLMFSKIMPALSDNPFSSSHNTHAPSAAPPPPPPEDDDLSALRNKLFARSGSFSENTIATINVMETVVLRHIDSVIQKFNTCSCDRCRCDISAYALNNLPPKYIVAEAARMAEAEKSISTKTVMDALIKAVIQVRSHPRH